MRTPCKLLLKHIHIHVIYDFCRHAEVKAIHPKESAVIEFLPVFHVYGLLIALVGLCSGISIVLLDHFDPNKYLALIEKYKVSTEQ